MGVSDGQYANENSFNAAFMARNQDTDTVGKVSLLNAGSTAIDDSQKFINQIADTNGETENDANRKNYSSNNYIADGDSRKTALEKLDVKAKDLQDQVDVHETRLDAHDVTLGDHEARIAQNEADIATHETRLDQHDLDLADHEGRITDLESNDMTIGGNKTFSQNVVVQGNLTVTGTTTTVNSTVTEIADPTLLLNNGGNDLSSEGSGIEIERSVTNAFIAFKNSLASKFEIGLAGSLREIIVSGVAQVIGGLKDFINGIKTDTINESTLDAGVTVDGVLIKDGLVDGEDVSDIRADLTTAEGNITNHEGRITTLETNNTQDVTLAPVGATPNPEGATLVGQVLNLEPADDLNPGVLSIVSQSIAGNKTFKDSAIFELGLQTDGPSYNNSYDVKSVGNDAASTGGVDPIPDNLRLATRLTNVGLSEIQMLEGEETGRLRLIINDTGNVIILKHQTGPNSAQQLSLGGADVSLPDGQCALFIWDTSTYWRLVQISTAGGGGGSVVREHVFKLNGNYSGLVVPATGQDTLYRFNSPCKITNVIFVRELAGSSGTTEIDVEVKPPAGAWGSIFSTTPKIQAAAGNEVGVAVGEVVPNTTAGVLSSSPFNVATGTLMRFDVVTKEAGNPHSISVIVIFEPQ